jgi:sigma-B regulation protein RsbU (phosphoserine phosphatase)
MMGWLAAVVILLISAGIIAVLFKGLRDVRAQMDKFVQDDKERAARRRRVFDVLHILGDSILRNEADNTLNRLITEGAVHVVRSQGAILYLFDERSQTLVPRHCTKDCPPLIALPERVVNQAATNAGTVGSFLRLHSIAPGEGLIGKVFEGGEPLNVPDIRKHPWFNGEANPIQQHIAALIAPLMHSGRKLGVLAAVTANTRPFEQHELEMFVSLVEQCGFVLGTARAHHEASAKREIEAELRNASEIQRILFPEKAPEMAGFDVVGRNIPARLVSGDYYDFFPVGADHTGIAIADVCGKGIPASLITAMCRSVLRSSARENLSPAAVLAAVNRNLFPDIREDMFITGIYAVASNNGSSLNLARAGHTTPYVWRKGSGTVEEVTAPGVAIGFDKGDVFERITKDVSVDMASGDVLLLYTDGVNEATDHKGLLFDDARIKASLATAAPNGAKAVVDHLCNAVDQFMAGHPLSDDLTLVAIAKK